MPELAFVKLADRLVESFQKAECLGRNACLHDAAVIGLACTGNQPALLQAVEETGHVRVMRDHAVADSAASEALRLGATENAKDIVLRAGKAGGFDELFGLLGEGVGGPQERHENVVLQRERAARGWEARGHGGSIILITTTVEM